MPDQPEVTPVVTAAHGSREIAEALGFEPDNHHNALLCPYCGDQRQKIKREVAERLRRQPWSNALPIADAIEKDEWDV